MPQSVLVFRTDDYRCGIDAASVVEVVPALAVRPLPGQAAFVAGVMDLRGAPMPVLDLRVRFGNAPRPMRVSDMLIVARAHGRPVAIWVDAVEAVTAAEALAWNEAGGMTVGDRSLAGVARSDDGLLAFHDLDAFMTACESDALAEALA